ncbi:dispersed gene family protein 1 (DGF-1) [Trypanosoma theileri]|uniref:Dispersed gene family protein 1 (DGF-1) n=1 Tax=Trypanosoma theileri TaxID=67003 RepID=A0A1X0NX80_9TRYP|nr:dispersed gene family protein 1 (DGF-1) [Trypanosoma theileri]ORC89316.1 dispersed gene family protein 1 (DGF-1) [Trypanosoma theileri]
MSFVSGSWLSLQGNKFPVKLLSLPSSPSSAEFVKSTLTLYNNSGGGSAVMDGAVTLGSAGSKFVVGCLSLNGEPLFPSDYESVGITGVTRTLECGACGIDVNCFSIMTREVLETCECICVRGVYERGCLPVFMPHPDGCNKLQPKPTFTNTATLTQSHSLTLTPTLTLTSTRTLTQTSTETLTPTMTLTSTRTLTQTSTETLTSTLTLTIPTPTVTLTLEVPFVAEQSEVNSEFAVFAGIAAALLTVGLFVAGGLGSILDIQTLGAFALMSCAPDYVRDSSVALPYFLSVFASLGPLWMVVGNALIALVFGCVHYGLTVVFERWRGVDTISAWAAMRFPSLTYLVAYLMHLGIFVGSISMLAMPDAHPQHYVIGVIGALYGVAFPVATYYFIAHYTDASFTKYWKFSKKPVYVRWLYPVGYWCPPAQVQMFGSMFTNMKGSYAYWCVFRLVVLCVVGLITAVQPPVDKCHIPYFCMAAVLFAGAAVLGFMNMMRSAFLTVMYTVSFVLLAVLCLINGANAISPSNRSLWAFVAFFILLIIVLLVIGVWCIVVWIYERHQWRDTDVDVDSDRGLETENEEGKMDKENPLMSSSNNTTSPQYTALNKDDKPTVDATDLDIKDFEEKPLDAGTTSANSDVPGEIVVERPRSRMRRRVPNRIRRSSNMFVTCPEAEGEELADDDM